MVNYSESSTVSPNTGRKVITINATVPVVPIGVGGGLVNDVLVNEESVVVDRVAHITLPSLPENLDARLQALESKYVQEIISKIDGGISLSKSVFYAGYPTTINVSGSISLPSEVTSDHVASISLNGNGESVSNSGVTSVSIQGTEVSATTTFTLNGNVSSPYTKSITKTATITKVCPIYMGIVDTDVDTVEEVVSAIANTDHLYSASSPISNIKTVTNKSFTYGANQRLAFICGQSDVKIKQVGALANDAYTAKGSTTINGVTAYVYVTSPQQAVTRNITFNA